MIIKKDGLINEIVYKFTVYNDGKYRLYPTLIGLRTLIKEISKTETTTEYIRFTPFYRNANQNNQMQFDDYMFYLECQDFIDETIQKKHIELCLDKKYDNLSEDEINEGKILFPLCKSNDSKTFNEKLNKYSKYLDDILPKLLNVAKVEMQLNDEDLSFGYFCFEVHSG